MEKQKWLDKLRTLKRATEFYYDMDLKVVRNPEYTMRKISTTKKCSCCGSERTKGVKIEFFKPINHLTVFQATLLYLVFVENKIPIDYAKYHKCKAGKRFIENIKNVER